MNSACGQYTLNSTISHKPYNYNLWTKITKQQQKNNKETKKGKRAKAKNERGILSLH